MKDCFKMCTAFHFGTYVNLYSFERSMKDLFLRGKQKSNIFQRKRQEPSVLPWQQHGRGHFVSFVMYISGVKFEEHCSKISGHIFDSLFYCLRLICVIQKREYL